QDGTYSDNFADFRVGTDFDLAPNHLGYVLFSTGHKSGGFNDNFSVTLPAGSSRSIAPTYNPEAVYDFEGGSKNEFADLGLRVNAAAFYYLYRDQVFQTLQQLSSIPPGGDPNQPPPASLVRFNAAKSHIFGLEVDGVIQLPLGLAFSASGLL